VEAVKVVYFKRYEVMNVKKSVVVGMSGGVDSSVAAALLVKEGYEVIGVTIKTHHFEYPGSNGKKDHNCCSLEGINDARAVAAQLGIRHYIWDLSAPFERSVIRHFIDAYLNGRTPNPCVICNRTIKWEEVLRRGGMFGSELVATGHYARVGRDESRGRYFISRGKDPQKDQSYALWGLTQESLSRTIFPLAGMTKSESRAIAEELGLKTASKGESFEICFIPDDDYARFLRQQVPGLEDRIEGGKVVFEGKEIGRHRGYPFYTVGQRRGIGVAAGEPVYVTSVDPEKNIVYVDREARLYHRELVAGNVNWQKFDNADAPRRIAAKVRYKDAGSPATLTGLGDGHILVRFDAPKRAITPGQSVVAYDADAPDDVVAGGIIDSVTDDGPNA